MSVLVLAGGGHSHALLLRRWAMHPEKRPEGLVILVSQRSTTLYSGMVPGLIAGRYNLDEVSIDLRQLTDQAGVALVIATITGIDLAGRQLLLEQRPALRFDRLSLNVGAITRAPSPCSQEHRDALTPIKPLEPVLDLLERHDGNPAAQSTWPPFTILGAGLAGLEVALALRRRWPERRLQLISKPEQPRPELAQAIAAAGIEHNVANRGDGDYGGPGLRCTGSQAPAWLEASGLPCCPQSGRVQTTSTLQVQGHPELFASGDCAVIREAARPPSGVWAVRAARPLARNLEAAGRGQPLQRWNPQRRALQLLGGHRQGHAVAWLLWGRWVLGPQAWLWHWKERIDRQFIRTFRTQPAMDHAATGAEPMRCNGCAAKLPAQSLETALNRAGLQTLGSAPEDANPLPGNLTSSGQPLLQSVDGFPALVSDPWLNARLTTLHACSDLWACGARVQAAQAVVTLPLSDAAIQEGLLEQTLGGIQSALRPQQACLLGGHTLESRQVAVAPASQSVQVVLSVCGTPTERLWPKRGLQAGDQLLISRSLGTGVLFAAAMEGQAHPSDLDMALEQMSTSQHHLLEELLTLQKAHPKDIHAATDITGFGLLGHLGEMLGPARPQEQLSVTLQAEAIPALPGALTLLENGKASSLAPANRRAWSLLDQDRVTLQFSGITPGSLQRQAVLELLVDPQTCGPLLVSVTRPVAEALLRSTSRSWTAIGSVAMASS